MKARSGCRDGKAFYMNKVVLWWVFIKRLVVRVARDALNTQRSGLSNYY